MKALLLPTVLGAFAFMAFLPIFADTLSQPETAAAKANRERVEKKLQSLIIDKVNFDQVDTQLVMDYLTTKSKELDPEHVGVKFVILNPSNLLSSPNPVHRESSGFEDVPLIDIVSYICSVGHLQYKIEGDSIIFSRTVAASTY